MGAVIVAGMRKGFFVLSMPVILAAVSFYGLGIARGSDLEAEYVQVRKIALKDPRVQEAFAKANERLNDRILEIDPSLKPIVDRQGQAPAPAPVTKPFLTRRVAAPQHAAPAAVAATGREHIVVTGETLDSIAHHYRVRVLTLERVNHITDARKLRVGQKLVIPVSETAPAAPAPSTPVPSAEPTAEPATTPVSEEQPKDGGSLWDKLKGGL
jgi:LysM repeat protein